MLAEERRLRIAEMLAVQRTVTAAALMQSLGVTAATVRRDLAALEEEGVLVRSHGGAVSRTLSTSFQLSYEALLRRKREEKEAIAREAERLILDGDTLFLEGSSTVYLLVQHLLRKNRLTVVTNSPPILAQLQQGGFANVMCTGGDLEKDTFYLSGTWTLRALSEIRVDKAILGVSAIDPAYGIWTARQSEAEVKKRIVKAAGTRIALADHSKFGRQSFAYVGPITEIDTLITDSGADSKALSEIRQLGVSVVITQVSPKRE
jgi:DeoR family transcriptional regulator, fructose operon transcriptional repressor